MSLIYVSISIKDISKYTIKDISKYTIMGNILFKLGLSRGDGPLSGDLLSGGETLQFDHKIVLLTLRPVYVINGEIEKYLPTGVDSLDLLVNQRIQKMENHVTALFGPPINQNLNVLINAFDDGQFYITVEKSNKTDFTIDDCQKIRKLLHDYNLSQSTKIILTAKEAMQSLFYDDLGDIRLGFLQLEPIEYI
jgi:hypothetical protein